MVAAHKMESISSSFHDGLCMCNQSRAKDGKAEMEEIKAESVQSEMERVRDIIHRLWLAL